MDIEKQQESADIIYGISMQFGPIHFIFGVQ